MRDRYKNYFAWYIVGCIYVLGLVQVAWLFYN